MVNYFSSATLQTTYGFNLVWSNDYSLGVLDADITNIRLGCSQSTVICLGAGPTGVDQLRVLACGNCYTITGGTQINTPLYSGGAYWYYGSGSIGFAPTSVITQNSADIYDLASDLRLSWHIGGSSGYRAGSYITYASDYTRYIYMKNGNPSVVPGAVTTTTTTTTVTLPISPVGITYAFLSSLFIF